MRSGDFSVERNLEHYRKAFAGIEDRHFVQRTFSSHAALVAKKSVNGHRMWRDYHGEPYDKAEFELVEGMWDHDYCSVCYFTIKDGHTYWQNVRRIKLLCDACHELFARTDLTVLEPLLGRTETAL